MSDGQCKRCGFPYLFVEHDCAAVEAMNDEAEAYADAMLSDPNREEKQP